jgi:nucleotide-binding universal stress UspA family protein
VHGPIVVGTDGSETAKSAVAQTAELAARLGANVHVVSATYRADGGPQADGPVKKALSDAGQMLGRHGVPYETHVVRGEPADAIIELAEQQGAELIVVGNKGMGGARR